MCGIAGIFSKDGCCNLNALKSMCHQQSTRGPDGEGYYINGNIGLGHLRLSIIDLFTGDQPMYSADKTKVIVFNGEIYNYQELRELLKEEGCLFDTESDTEVVMQAIQHWGIKAALSKFEGMFAFALYDINNKNLIVSRDKFGEKPLYYSDDEKTFSFASELKAFESNLKTHEIDILALNYFLTLSYIPAPFTIYKNIQKLEAGCYLAINSDGELIKERYFDLAQYLSENQTQINDFHKAQDLIKETVLKSVSSRMISDVPLGVFLSGGIDSSIVAAIMSKLSKVPINTFTIGFREKSYDESDRAELVAKHIKSNHTVRFIDYKDVVNMVDEIILHYDEPFGDSSAIPTYYVAKLARETVKVVLTGDCADELFGGYDKYLGPYYSENFRKLPLFLQTLAKKIVLNIPHNRLTNSYLRKAKKVISNAELSAFDLHYNLMSLGFNDFERASLLHMEYYADIKQEIEKTYNSYVGDSTLSRSQFTDIKIVLEGDMFVKTDRVCMKNSLESRAPFIDSKIVRAIFQMPERFKINGNNKKYILKETFKDILPARTLKFQKKGFGIPIDYWFKNELKKELELLLCKERIEQQGIFNYLEVSRLIDEHQKGKENHKGKLWNLFVFQKWYFSKWN